MPHIQESHPEPDERIIMPKFDSKKAETPVFEILNGEYPFEIMAVDNGISKGAKTNGSEVREVKLKFFADKTFATPKAQWTEDFIYHEKTEWKVFVFARCVGLDPKDGDEIDIDASWIGRRGWSRCRPETDSDKTKIDPQTGKVRQYNRVGEFIANKEKLPRNTAITTTAADPFASKEEDRPF